MMLFHVDFKMEFKIDHIEFKNKSFNKSVVFKVFK